MNHGYRMSQLRCVLVPGTSEEVWGHNKDAPCGVGWKHGDWA